MSESKLQYIVTKKKLLKSKYTFSKFAVLHHLPGLGAYKGADSWLYEFDLSNNKQAQSFLMLKMVDDIVLDVNSSNIKNIDIFFSTLEKHQEISAKRKEIDLEISKAKTLMNYHRLILNEPDKEVMTKLRQAYRYAEKNRENKLNEAFPSNERKRVMKIIEQVHRDICFAVWSKI